MALSEAALKFAFAGGVETKMDPKAVPSTKLLTLENGVFTRAISIQKRNGYSGFAADADARRLGVRDDELLEFTSRSCRSRQTGTEQWSDVGACFSAVGTDRPLVKTGTQQTQPDAATLDGVTTVAWEDSRGGVWWSVVDAASGRVLKAPVQANATGISPRCVACGTNLHIYYAVAIARSVFVVVVNPADASQMVSPVLLIDDLDSTNPAYDACETERADRPAAITWKEHGTNDYRVGYVDDSGVLGNALTGHPTVITYTFTNLLATSPIAIAFWNGNGGTGDVIGVAFVDNGNGGNVQTFSGGDDVSPIDEILTFGGIYITTDVQRIALTFADSDTTSPPPIAWVVFEEAAAAASNRYCRMFSIDVDSGGVQSIDSVRSAGLASGAWSVGADAFAVFVHDTTYFNTYVTLRLSDSFPVGRHAAGSAAGAPPRKHLPTARVDDSVVSIALPVRDRLISENGDKFRETGIRLVSMDFDSEDSHQYAQLGRGLYLAGACPLHYDGRVWTEQGFHIGPELIATTPAAGGSMTISTTYLYRAWYEWTDAQGEVHRGPVSFGTLVTMGGADTQVTLTLPTLRITKKENVRICVARSLAAKTGNTAQLFRVTSLDPSTAGAVNGYVASDPTVDTVTFIDRMSDITLALQESLYTDGGILSNDPATLGSVLARGKSRLFFTDSSNPNLIRYSQELEDGYGAEIPPELQVVVDPFGGPVTALANQDDRVIVFKASAIYTFSGDGPTASGDVANGGFSRPQLVTSDVGCTDPSSIVLTPAGHMFKSAKGIYLIDNSGSVQYVGAPVEAYNAQRVRRATVMPNRTHVVFLPDTGMALLYDYLFNQWSTFTNHTGYDAAVIGNTYHYLRTDARVFRETPGVYSDDGQRIQLRIETAWLHMQEQLQGFQHFWFVHLLGTWMSPHQLGLQYRIDYESQWSAERWLDATGLTSSTGWITGDGANPIGEEPITGTAYGDGVYGDGPYGGTGAGVYAWRMRLSEKGHSVQFRIRDFEADGYMGASFEPTELLLLGGIKNAARRQYTKSRST